MGRQSLRAGLFGCEKAVNSLTLSLAAALLGPRGITVNAVLPGLTEPDFVGGLLAVSDRHEALAGATPLGCLGRPGDVADAVAMLGSKDAGWVTGQIVKVTGGMRL